MVEVPGLTLILFERDTNYRQIFTDGRPLPEDPTPSFNGYSTAKWDGDTLVVQSVGFKDNLWPDISGTPLTDAAKVTERFRRPTFGKLEIDITIDDPRAYTKPWSIRVNQSSGSGSGNARVRLSRKRKDVPHLVGNEYAKYDPKFVVIRGRNQRGFSDAARRRGELRIRACA
jgi:hypothetical protein